MKFRSLFLSGVAALLLTSTVAAQFNPGSLYSEGTMTVLSKPFAPQGHGVLQGSTPGYSPIDVWCTDYLGALHTGHTYKASFTSLAGDLSGTVHGNAGLTGYLKAAFLYKYLKAATDANDSGTARDIHFALWHFLGGDPAATRPGEAAWKTLANDNYVAHIGDGRWYFVVTDIDPDDDGRHQEFLTYATPEPGTYALLATGLIGLSVAGIRRRKKDIV